MDSAKKTVETLLKAADIKINGSRPWDIQVHNEKFYSRALRYRELGVGEAYMDGWWDCKQLDEFIARVMDADVTRKMQISPVVVSKALAAIIFNRQKVDKAAKNASHHYNIGNDLYSRMLDKRMIYSCGYWETAKNLDEAQEAKLDRICKKLHLKKGMDLLDIGCGWGGFAEFASKKYGVKVTGISPASEQVKFAKERTKGLPVTILQKDYREVKGKFDRIVSIGMIEHVGHKNYNTFFSVCERLLKPNGLMLHHMIGGNKSSASTDPWTDKYIFPGGVIPSLTQIAKAVEKKFIIEDVENFGPYYDKTLLAWYNNFTKHYHEIQDKYDERFRRMWEFYLLASAGTFRARNLQLWQIVFSRIERSRTYKAIR